MVNEVKVLDNTITEAKKIPKPRTPPPEPKEEKPPKGGQGKKGKVNNYACRSDDPLPSRDSCVSFQAASPAAKKRGKTPPTKKGATAPADPQPDSPTSRTPVLTADELLNRQRKIQMCTEYKEALMLEGKMHACADTPRHGVVSVTESRVKVRLELIKHKSVACFDMLKVRLVLLVVLPCVISASCSRQTLPCTRRWTSGWRRAMTRRWGGNYRPVQW